MQLTPLSKRRLANFRANKRGYWSLWIFTGLFVASLFAELIANDKPILIKFAGELYAPVFIDYPETLFGGFLETTAEYADPEVREMIEEKGWIVWPLIHFSYDTVNYELTLPAPAPPSDLNWLGTDDQGRDVVLAARLIRRVHELLGDGVEAFVLPQDLCDGLVVNHVVETIGAQEVPIAHERLFDDHIYPHLFAKAKRSHNHILVAEICDLFVAHLFHTSIVIEHRVILGHQPKLAATEPIHPAVTDVTDEAASLIHVE